MPYREKIFSTWIVVLILAPAFAVPALYAWSANMGSTVPPVVPLGIAILLLLTGINFAYLTITVEGGTLTVAYGIFRRKIPLQSIESIQKDDTPWWKYGGFGVRIARVEGNWRIVYNVVGLKNVLVILKEGGFTQVAFSTRDQDKVIAALSRR